MDGNRFDDIGRALSGHGSRRDALRVLAGALLGVVAGDQATDAPAKPKKKNKKGCPKRPCPQGHQRNKRTCACPAVARSFINTG